MDTKLKKVNEQEIKLKICLTVVIFCCFFLFGMGFGMAASFFLSLIFTCMAYLILHEHLRKRVREYQEILQIAGKMAEGNFDAITSEDLGVFEPVKEELCKIQNGFSAAIAKEVKSERMKTELVTNVSHDLKTPLTAITTYVELLKNPDITEEERNSYIETLETKSARMKVLIEDLFELSKASSRDVTLNPAEVDIVHLIKQVVVEHKEAYEKAGLQVCWNLLEEKVELLLDNQKTYRIFENLFLNIEKYAMKNSRVYIEAAVKENVEITIKNMSAEPLNIPAEQLTERFVRGDASRNTEGSGLGLAIAKSFVEIQNGIFEVIVDGDLFKTVIVWKKNVEQL